MRAIDLLATTALVACVAPYDGDNAPADDTDPDQPPGSMSTPESGNDVRCTQPPVTAAAAGFRNWGSSYVAEHGDPHHRGRDLITTTDATSQVLTGKITYGPTDKDLADEDVDVFACMTKGWTKLGTAVTDDNGEFSLALTADARLPAGMRDLYLSVAGDRTGAAFLALVAEPGAAIIVSDVDGTLTASENAYPYALAEGNPEATEAHPDAPAALTAAANAGVHIIYITARGDRFTQDTRDWFAAKGFPRGPVKLPPSIVTVPGEDTIEFKTSALASLAGFTLVAGIGNRATDVAACGNAGLPPERIFIKLAEFEDEVAADLEVGRATGFFEYSVLRSDHLETKLR